MVKLTYVNGHILELPSSLYSQDAHKALFEGTFGAIIDEAICMDKVDSKTILFSLPNVVLMLFKEQYSNLKLYSEYRALKNYIQLQKRKTDFVLLNKEDRVLTIIAFKNQEIIYQNSFTVHTLDDILYFTLNVYKQLGFDKTIPLTIMGNYSDSAATLNYLKKFISKVETATYRPGYNLSYTFKEEKAFQHTLLLEQTLCE